MVIPSRTNFPNRVFNHSTLWKKTCQTSSIKRYEGNIKVIPFIKNNSLFSCINTSLFQKQNRSEQISLLSGFYPNVCHFSSKKDSHPLKTTISSLQAKKRLQRKKKTVMDSTEEVFDK